MLKAIKYFIIPFLALVSITLQGQVYKNFVHYNTENGLPTNELYNGIQSKDGYIFITSNVGLIRYDGYEFKIFDAKDGLTDADIIYCNEDSLGRIWVGPINSDLYFYYKGVIYNRFNNKLVKKIYEELKSEDFFKITIYKNHIVFYKHNLKKIIKLTNNKIEIINFKFNKKLQTLGTSFNIDFGDKLIVSDNFITYKIYANNKNKIEKNKITINGSPIFFYEKKLYSCINAEKKLYEINLENLKIEKKIAYKELKINYNIYDITVKNNNIYYAAGSSIFKSDLNFNHPEIICNLDSKILISGFIFDKNDNLWVLSRNKGLFYFEKLNNQNSYSIPYFQDKPISKIFLSDSNNLYTFSDNAFLEINSKTLKYNKKNIHFNEEGIITLKYIYQFNELLYYFFSNEIISVFNTKTKLNYLIPKAKLKRIGSIKSMAIKNIDSIFISTSSGLFLMNKNRFIKIYNKRTTSVCYVKKENKIYFGSISSLYEYNLNSNKIIEIGNKNNKLNQRILLLKIDKLNNIWVATGTGTLFYLRNNKIIYTLNTSNGLIGNLITNIHINNKNEACFSTNKGVTILKYTIENNSFKKNKLESFTKEDGLKEVYINDAFLKDSLLYTASNSGLNITNLKSSKNDVDQLMQIIELKVNDKIIPYYSKYKFKYNENYAKIKYTNFNFSKTNSYYKYRLLPIQNKWISTLDRSKEFGPLEPQKYKFEIQLINKNNLPISEIKSLQFEIIPAYWQTTWFKIILFLFLAFVLFLIIYNYNSKRHQALNFSNQLSDLKIKALRAQMNPHFIFNCLNTIQSYINQGDNLESNRFIAKFSTLIRQTLNLSDETYISIEDEVKYLNTYIELEWLRFNQNFEYTILVNGINNPKKIFIPSMLIQPLVENAIRHGLRNIQSGGKLEIRITKAQQQEIEIQVEDNGIGIRQLNINDKTQSSKGINIIKDRIKTYSEIIKKEITIEFIDSSEKNSNNIGTLVKVIIPL